MVCVSIIIPVYNQENYLARCLDTLLTQTLHDIEIICVNDGSTDKSAEILDSYAERDPRVKVINQINSGVSEARNRGLRSADREIIGFVDPDDFVESDFFEKLYNAANENKCDIACANIIRENNRKSKIIIQYDRQEIACSVREKFELAGLPEHCYIWNKIYLRKKLIDANIFFPAGMVYEDMIFSPEAIEALGNAVSVPETWYHYWNNGDSITKNDSDQNRADKLNANRHLVEKCLKYNVKLSGRGTVMCKREYFLFGIKILKIYIHRATRNYYLFGLIPVLVIRDKI